MGEAKRRKVIVCACGHPLSEHAASPFGRRVGPQKECRQCKCGHPKPAPRMDAPRRPFSPVLAQLIAIAATADMGPRR